VEVRGQLHAPAVLPAAKEPRYPLDRRLGGPQRQSGRGGEERESNAITPIVQPVQCLNKLYYGFVAVIAQSV
jgi:hypothetical protein